MSTAGEICSRASTTLFDAVQVRWEESELLEYLTDAQREAVLLKPTAYTKNEAVQLVSGSVQSIPADGVSFVDISANMGSDGLTPGGSVGQIDRTVLDASRSNWRAGTANINARHYIYDDRDPTRFEVYPPQPEPAGYLQVVYAAVPPVLDNVADELVLPEIYDTALYYMVLSRAYAKSTGTQDLIKSSNYLQIAHQLIAGRKLSLRELHPEQMAERAKR